MQPFSVICETCRAQLRVRSQRMIGQIHGCPKCGGMVLIQTPAGWADTPSETAIPSVTAAAPINPQPVVAPPAAQPVVAQSFQDVGDLGGIDLTTPAGAISPAEIPVATAQRWGRRVVWGSVAGSAAIVAASLVWTLWPGSDEQVASVVPPGMVGDSIVGNTSEAPTEIAPVEPHATVVNKPEIAPEPESDPPVEFALPEPPPAAEPPALTAEPVENSPPAPAEAVVANTPLLPTVDPRDVDPENLDLILRRNLASNSPLQAADSAESEQLPAVPDLKVGDGSEEATLASLESNLAAAVKDSEPETVRRGPTSAEDLQPAGIDQLLELTIPAIEVPRLPLHRAVAMLTELTAIPITLDPAALRMAGVSVDREVAIRGQNVTAAELVRTTLAAAKLEYLQRGDQLIVVRPEADTVGKRNYQVADLFAAGTADAPQVAKLIQTLVAPQTWRGQGGEGEIKAAGDQLAVTQSQQVHYDALIFCERLRKARSLPLRSRYPTALLRTKPLEAALAPRLDRRTTFSFVTWTPLPEVFRHWQERAGLTILVDWAALADVQLAPASTIACAVEGVSWRDALDEVLTPLGLAWVPVDEKTIQITSRAAAEAHQYVEFYPLTEPRDAETIVAELRAGLPESCAIVLDETSRSLIVRANAAGQWHVATQLALGSGGQAR